MKGSLLNKGKLVTKISNVIIKKGIPILDRGHVVGRNADSVTFNPDSPIPQASLLNCDYEIHLDDGQKFSITAPSVRGGANGMSASAMINPSVENDDGI